MQNRILTENFSKNLNFKTEDNVHAGKLQEKNIEKNINLFASFKSLKKSDPELDPDPLVKGADLRIQIRTKMSQIPKHCILQAEYHF